MSATVEVASVSLRWNTPHPSLRFAPIHLLPQGEKGEAPRPKAEPATAGRRPSGAPAQGQPRQRRCGP
ncbi:hypothetical protein FJW05_19580 [Mesorhizobium sp. B2-9-1]|nr:hypothetical protein FJW05_19580 [Mesorhizobium sp. B2-9-1]TPJ22616.1 hypothetical protein FJ425_23675 [Mesorhizobium sp. B2-7-2]